MKIRRAAFVLLLLCLFVYPFGAGYAQPRYSPEVRAERETNWMRDSLRLSPEKLKRVSVISLNYNRKMDSINDAGIKNKEKALQQLMNRKDADIKKLLSRSAYQRYCKREKLIRRMDKVEYKGRHQPY